MKSKEEPALGGSHTLAMAGKTCVVTGANSGIGLETARALALMGARVVMVCRDRTKGENARKDILSSISHSETAQNDSSFPPAPTTDPSCSAIRNSTIKNTENSVIIPGEQPSPSVYSVPTAVESDPNVKRPPQERIRRNRPSPQNPRTMVIGEDPIDLVIADLASLTSIRKAVQEIRQKYDVIDVLVNNAGLIKAGYTFTEDGLEWTMAVNHYAPFLFTHLLLEPLLKAPAGRVVTVSSGAHRMGRIDIQGLEKAREGKKAGGRGKGKARYLEFLVYANSKLANILFTKELAKRLSGTTVTANCLHPGVVRTNFGKSATKLFYAGFMLAWPFMISPKQGARTSVYLASSPEVSGVSGEYFNRRRRARVTRNGKNMEMANMLWEHSERIVGLGGEEKVEQVLKGMSNGMSGKKI
jgi:retinol dehydrogenase 12